MIECIAQKAIAELEVQLASWAVAATLSLDDLDGPKVFEEGVEFDNPN